MKSEDDIPDFLKFHEKVEASVPIDDDCDDSISTTCMYTEMTLKNAKLYGPKFPIIAAPTMHENGSRGPLVKP